MKDKPTRDTPPVKETVLDVLLDAYKCASIHVQCGKCKEATDVYLLPESILTRIEEAALWTNKAVREISDLVDGIYMDPDCAEPNALAIFDLVSEIQSLRPVESKKGTPNTGELA